MNVTAHLINIMQGTMEWLSPLGYTSSMYAGPRKEIMVHHKDTETKPYPHIVLQLDPLEREVVNVMFNMPAATMKHIRKFKELTDSGKSTEDAIKEMIATADKNQIMLVANCAWLDPNVEKIINRMMFFADVFDTYGSLE